MKTRSLKAILANGAAVAALFYANAALAQTHAFDIPAEEAGKSIPEFARQAGIQIVAPGEVLRGVNTQAVKGSLDIHPALQTLLAGTNLNIASNDGQTVILAATQKNVEAAPVATATDERAAETRNASIETVTVTASKRSEAVKEVPAAVTALTADQLQNLAISDFHDYMGYVPGLELNDAGSAGHGAIILRGLNSGWEQTTPTVGFYLNDTVFTPSSASSVGALVFPDPDLADVERVEVLKGPQSTLYGASTLGGLIKIVYKEPDLDNFSGDLGISGVTATDGGSGYSARGDVNIPIIPGELAGRISLFERNDPGFVDNVLRGEKDVNSDRVGGGRIALRFTPNDKLDIELTAMDQSIRSHGWAQVDLDPNTLRPVYGPNKYSAFFDGGASTQLALVSLTANYDTGIGTLTNVTSFARYEDKEFLDYTPSYSALFPDFGETNPNAALLGTLIPQMKKFTEELRFNSTRMGNFEWQLGVFYTREQVSYDAILSGVEYPTGAPLTPPYDNWINALTDASYREYAVFGDVTYYFTDNLDATAGIRYSDNAQRAIAVSTGLLGGGPATVSNSNQSDESYLFTIRWRPTEALSTYARAASAYRPGGPQFSPAPGVPSSFGPDTVWDYEVGAKGQWLDGRLSANIDAYHIDWQNIQLNALVDGLTVTGNGGSAESNGMEFEGQFELLRGLIVGVHGAYDQTRMDTVNPTSTAGAVVGDPLPYTPKWSGGVTADYSFPVTPDISGGVGASWLYQGSRVTSFSNDQLNSRVDLPSYSTVALRGHVDWQNYTLSLHIDNVANEQAYNTVVIGRIFPGQPIDPLGTPIEPRTFRLSLDARF